MPVLLLLTFRGTFRHKSSMGSNVISLWKHLKQGTLLRFEWHKGEAPSLVISAACRAQSWRTATAPNNDSHWERGADLQTLHSWSYIPFIKTSMCSRQMLQNQVLQKPQPIPRQKCQPLHPATAAGARWGAGVVRKGVGGERRIQESYTNFPIRNCCLISPNLHQDFKYLLECQHLKK